jgi:hypothetical protein
VWIELAREKHARGLQDLIRPAQLEVLTAQLADLLTLLDGGHVVTPPLVRFDLAHVLTQRLASDPVDQQLHELAANADTPPATLASQLVQAGIAQAAKDGKVRPLRTTPALAGARTDQQPPWLQPYGGDPEWRQEMWGAIVALHGRYPHKLQALKDKWWTDDSTTETLSALAVWRAELDDAGQDPREELAFQTQLADYAQHLRQQSGGVTKTWKPDAPPPEWAVE